jgi:hypothetical protein
VWQLRFLREPISNGNPTEQALIREWWHTAERARGRVVWEYRLFNWFADAVWFPDEPLDGEECPGLANTVMYPLKGRTIVLCESKLNFNPELIGQALVYRSLAIRLGANVKSVVVIASKGDDLLSKVATDLGLTVVIRPPAP